MGSDKFQDFRERELRSRFSHKVKLPILVKVTKISPNGETDIAPTADALKEALGVDVMLKMAQYSSFEGVRSATNKIL